MPGDVFREYVEKKVLDKVADEITRTALCCHEALQDYWDRSDEGFEAMRHGLERALQLLGYPVPDYAQRDQEWEEENQPWDEPERQEDQ